MFLAASESSKKTLALTEANLVTKFSELDSVQKTEILKKIDISEAQLKVFFENLDRKSQEKLFDLIKPEFESVKNEINESKDWELTEDLKRGFLNQFNSWKVDKSKCKIKIIPLAGNEISYKMSRHLHDFLENEAFQVETRDVQLMFNGYGIKTDFKDNRITLYVGRKP
jgi:hypothetical protein